jgi:hypothetical protein
MPGEWIGWGVTLESWWSRHLETGVQIPGGAQLVALTPTDGATENGYMVTKEMIKVARDSIYN